MSQLMMAEITGCQETGPGVWVTELLAPSLAQAAVPGQFIHIRCGEDSDPLLRRPISIHAVCRQSGLVKIMFQVVGKGTAWLAGRRDGWLDIMGPLGRGFTMLTAEKTGTAAVPRLVVGGGIGAAPLYFLLQELAGTGYAEHVKVLLGARNAEQLLIHNAVKLLGFSVSVATDDGSAGYQGPVTDLLAEELQCKPGYVYACGPAPMLKTLCGMLHNAGVPGEVSVEERMACGVGACLSCVCRVKDAGGLETFRHACVDGPVFAAGEVVW
ncbi:Dihydroorotate dehydrogenase B (NAD(+)), electron transfer subunit [Sporotomaculum syntrophicum]|uniref:Dihydroorotate dehydrogenase B (NAD(+)), electron transfer subunit n=1 Tax=Sporotomaculum syntrophicum TaxID=182264 RepID=A0A9D3AY13_9FIRM|nr:dihydroorotate dehydrogenase electron transfer subunit [Sporotomaculum syntrophicum]KAF1085572.1 Dihydroorotate dehydrogenase B (NAD(+)), electron transfer subunit [Sporotomaculum syntrophicum]